VPDTQQTVNISSIPYSGATTTLNINVAINWGANPVGPATVAASFVGDPVQVCFKTLVSAAVCPLVNAVGNTANAVTSGAGGDAPAGNSSGTASFVQTDPSCPVVGIPLVSDGLGVGFVLLAAGGLLLAHRRRRLPTNPFATNGTRQ